ncbi:hypothetical protein [Embleya sp. NPDC059259]|uniref:hypothetical protein n=1 Tax=unclassified Embleya TaxID=2699296 RepID=UPI0036AE0100
MPAALLWPAGAAEGTDLDALEDRVDREVSDAVRAAEQAPEEPVDDLLRFVTTPPEVRT